MTNNLALWNSVEKTDPSYTKAFSRGGGFRGTATNATWLAKRATEQFGPCGIGWGVNVIDEQYVPGCAGDVVHVVRIKLWYMLDGKRGEIEHYGQTDFTGKNKNGPYTDSEAPKKSLTDAMTKALSLLGFAADVHLGLFDDNKYVSELKAEFAEKERESSQDESVKNYINICHERMAQAHSAADLKAWWSGQEIIRDNLGIKNGMPEYAALFKAFIARGKDLSLPQVARAS